MDKLKSVCANCKYAQVCGSDDRTEPCEGKTVSIKIINATPHEVRIIKEGSATIICEPSGILPRVSQTTEVIGELDGITITKNKYGEVENLPPYENGIWYIVSAMVANAMPEREDLLIPNESVRDEHGRIIGCRSLARVR